MIDELIELVVSVRSYVVTAVVLVSLSTLFTTVLVFLLSLRLRRREIATMHRIGAARGRVRGILATEIVGTVAMAVCLAVIMTALTARFGAALVQSLVMQ